VSEKRSKAYRHGLLAETVAALLLRLKGHRIVARRYKTPVGEIDLVALKGQRLAFVEVSGAASSGPRNIGLPATPTLPPRPRLRRGASGALGLAALYRIFTRTSVPSPGSPLKRREGEG
jgi:Uncharacterised protein family UPF0102